MTTKIVSSFCLLGDNFDPMEITKAIPISSVKIWKKGDLVIKQSVVLKHKNNGWLLEIEAVSMSVEEQMVQLLNTIRPYISQIVYACKRLNLKAGFSSAIYIESNEIPSLFLETGIIREIADLNASLDVDIYFLDSE